MPDVNVNTGDGRRFENGGRIKISNGADVFIVANIEAGSLTWANGGREVQQDLDRGELLDPTYGDKRPSTIEFGIRFATTHGAQSLASLMETATITDGKPRLYTLIVELFDDIGQSAGESLTWAESYFTSNMNMSAAGAGAGRDTARFSMASKTNEAAHATLP